MTTTDLEATARGQADGSVRANSTELLQSLLVVQFAILDELRRRPAATAPTPQAAPNRRR